MKSFSAKSHLKKVNFAFLMTQSTWLSIKEKKGIVKLKISELAAPIWG